MAPLQPENAPASLNDDNGRAGSPHREDRLQMKRVKQMPDSVLNNIFQNHDVYIGGAAMGKGFRHAARHLLRAEKAKLMQDPVSADGTPTRVIEDPFFVCDLGVVISQFYQWKKHFPRVAPYYAVKCNPDPVIVKTLATLGCNFDCASRNEIILVQESSAHLLKKPDIIYANPCKSRSHIIDAVRRGVRRVTFDNVSEVAKCAQISKDIELILRIITDDTGSQCRLSSKFGAPRNHWKQLLRAAKNNGLSVVGVSFHVGSGCRDSSRYEMALRDAREVIDMGRKEFGFNMHILDIGGGFPGEAHSLWNPTDLDEEVDAQVEQDEDDEEDVREDLQEEEEKKKEHAEQPLMYFSDIADHVSPLLDEIFPDTDINIIGEPGRFLVAASSTLVVAVTSIRSNIMDDTEEPEAISDREAAVIMNAVTREEEDEIVRGQGTTDHPIMDAIIEQIADYSQLYARQQLANQEVGGLFDGSTRGFVDFAEGISEEENQPHSVEGITAGIVGDCMDEDQRPRTLSFSGDLPSLALASAGEAVVSGVVKQAIADSAAATDDFAYYVNDGVYGGFNNLMFDHAAPRPRLLRNNPLKERPETDKKRSYESQSSTSGSDDSRDLDLFPSTIFGPTCDSIDVICRSVLLPKLAIGDFLYFENMGAYTSAAASCFNGFELTKKSYVCSVLPETINGKRAVEAN